jgi:hypothetical protein
VGLAVSAGRVGEAGGARSAGPEARREARGFGECLATARRAARQQAAGAARRAAGGEASSFLDGAASPGAALSRRRTQADGQDHGLALRRRHLDGSERADLERKAESAPAAGPWAPGNAGGGAAAAHAPAGPPPVDLAAAVEKLALAVERRDRALGPELHLDLGGRLSVRLARGENGVEVVFAGEARLARLAEAELPAVLARLRERGIAVSRAEVRVAREAAPAGGGAVANAAGPAR